VQGDLAILRGLGVAIVSLLIISRILLWRYPCCITIVAEKIQAFMSVVAKLSLLIPLSLTILVLLKTVLQLSLYFSGYTVYAADDFGRT
jgi:hypothetical protein